MTHESPGFHLDSKISGTHSQHVPTHDLAIHTPEHECTRSKCKNACLFNMCRPTSQKMLRSTFRIAWLPTFRKWKPMIQEPAPTYFGDNRISPLYKYRHATRYSTSDIFIYKAIFLLYKRTDLSIGVRQASILSKHPRQLSCFAARDYPYLLKLLSPN
jgi:hypothetical protein